MNQTTSVIKNSDLDKVKDAIDPEFVIENVHKTHDNGFTSFEASGVQVQRLISVWVSVSKL